MSTSTPDRGRLTDALVAHLVVNNLLAERGIVFGDGEAPAAAGWTGNEPGVGEFVASLVLTTLLSQPTPAPETLRSEHSSWRMAYQLRATGGTRTQADEAADRGRHAMEDFPADEYNLGEMWKVQRILFPRLSGVRIQKVSDVAQWISDDVAEVWVFRSAR